MTSKKDPDIVVTSALPYANGPIHIGHLVEYVQTDVYVRFLKLSGKDAVYCCADDQHGTPIEINAAKAGVTPQEFIKKWYEEHKEDFARYGVVFDSYSATDSEENRQLVESIFATLQEAGLIYEKEIEQLYSEKDERFLPDRFVKGTCPKCNAADQYGDVCEQCGATYKPTDLIEPYSVLSGDTPVLRKSTHLFFKLSDPGVIAGLRKWLKDTPLQQEVKNQMLNWIERGLDDWCISRDGPYFGFKIPGNNKYFYVWLDAPIGYISSLAHLVGGTEKVKEVWNSSLIRHFIGKDIIYFHLLFWPAVLHASGWARPSDIIVHGFLTVDGEKMSKSRGTFLTAKEFAEKVPDTEFLRFYYAANLTHSMTDIDLNLEDFTQRINTELIGNIANFVYRTLSFIKSKYGGKLPTLDQAHLTFYKNLIGKSVGLEFSHEYERYAFRQVVQRILLFSQLGNQYFQGEEPWKNPDAKKQEIAVCAHLVRDLSILLGPIVPGYCEKVQKQLGVEKLSFENLGDSLGELKINDPEIVWRPIDPLHFGPAERVITPADLKLIVAKIVRVEKHPKADKLYIEHVDDGSGTERVIVSGLVPYYKPEELLGKRIILVDNLKPAKLRGVESRGMLLAAQAGDGMLEVLEVPGAAPGTPVLIEGFEQGEKEITIDEFFKVKITVQSGTVRCDGAPLSADGAVLGTQTVKDGQVA